MCILTVPYWNCVDDVGQVFASEAVCITRRPKQQELQVQAIREAGAKSTPRRRANGGKQILRAASQPDGLNVERHDIERELGSTQARAHAAAPRPPCRKGQTLIDFPNGDDLIVAINRAWRSMPATSWGVAGLMRMATFL